MAVLQALLALPSICVFGGSLRDALRGVQRDDSDIDVFVRISEEGMRLVKSKSDLPNAEFLSICNISPNASKFVCQQIALLLVEELHYENVRVERIVCYDFSLHSYRIHYGRNKKIDIVMLRQNHQVDFDVNSLYWDGELKTLLNCAVEDICYSLQRNIALMQSSFFASNKFDERVKKMKSYGFSLEGDQPVELQPINPPKYIPKINVNAVLPDEYYITGREAVLRFINGPICRHVTVVGKNIANLQKCLPFRTRRVGKTLYYPAGSIKLVSSADNDVDIFNLLIKENGDIEDLSFEQNLFSRMINRRYQAKNPEPLLQAFEFQLIK